MAAPPYSLTYKKVDYSVYNIELSYPTRGPREQTNKATTKGEISD